MWWQIGANTVQVTKYNHRRLEETTMFHVKHWFLEWLIPPDTNVSKNKYQSIDMIQTFHISIFSSHDE